MPGLTAARLDALAEVAEAHGMLRLSAVRVDHQGFAPARAALDRYLADGREGEMTFVSRSADVRRDPGRMLPNAATLLVGLVPYGGEPGPIARYARSSDYHTELHHRLEPVVARLHEMLPGTESLICVDTKPVLERAAAALAGLGFVGKNGLVIAPGLGSYVLLGVVLTTAALEAPDAVDDPAAATWDACGSCTRCLDACPTAAFVAPGELDPRRCISYLTIEHRGPIAPELADAMGERIAGCDVCQEVCPYNASRRRDGRIPEPAWLPAPRGAAADVEDLTRLVNVRSSPYRAFVRHTALRRIPRRSMRRNVLLALGNRPGPLDDRTRQEVEQAAADDDPQVAAAARRVLARRGP